MKIRKNIIFLLIIIATSMTLLCMTLMFNIVRDGRIRLLYKTNYNELLIAGRNILIQANIKYEDPIAGGRVDKYYEIPKHVKIPKIISSLKRIGKPSIYIHNDGFLRIVIGKNRDNLYGVYIYPEKFEESYENYHYGNKELISGLWYFDIGYEEYRDYDETIDSLIKTGKYPY